MNLVLPRLLLLLSIKLWVFPIAKCHNTQSEEHLFNLIKSSLSSSSSQQNNFSVFEENNDVVLSSSSSVYIGPQKGLMEADKIGALPEQPAGVEFEQYSGYVTVDPTAGRSLFYYFVESPLNSSAKPLLLYISGGPACSAIGNGGFLEAGPFKVASDGKTLYPNIYSWNKVANLLFLESPAGVGFTYSKNSSDYDATCDERAAIDAYTFLANWFERFPHYKSRDFYMVGESYSGHYVPQLAHTILSHNKNNSKNNLPFINLKGIAIGNGLLDLDLVVRGIFEYTWTHALISDETHEAIIKNCDFDNHNYSDNCNKLRLTGLLELGNIDVGNIYGPSCDPNATKPQSSFSEYDPCSSFYVEAYLNKKNVQKALHTINTTWKLCSRRCQLANMRDAPKSMLPLIKQLIADGLNIWLYSGDTDAFISVTSTKYAIKALKLPVLTAWRPWHSNGGKEVGGYVQTYKGLTFVTIRGAGHAATWHKPERGLTMISSFLQGKSPP